MNIVNGNQYNSLDPKRLDIIEKNNKITFPSDYKRFLIEYNGGKPVPSFLPNKKIEIKILFGLHDGPNYENLQWNANVYLNRIPSWYIPIGADTADNLILMSLWEGNFGTICIWYHENECTTGDADNYFDNMEFLASSFNEFLNMLIPEKNN